MSLTVGTGAALRKLIPSPLVLPGSEAWCYYLAEDNWLLGGVIHDAGNAIRWFADNLMEANVSVEQTILQMNRLAGETPVGAEGLLFLPLFGGDRCPHYRPNAKGAVMGITFCHTRAHIVRALMEGLTYHLFTVYRMLSPDFQSELMVTGGILKSPVWLKIVADLFGKTLHIPGVQETTAWGGILMGLKSIGVIDSLEEGEGMITTGGKEEPDLNNSKVYQGLITEYDHLYTQLYG